MKKEDTTVKACSPLGIGEVYELEYARKLKQAIFCSAEKDTVNRKVFLFIDSTTLHPYRLLEQDYLRETGKNIKHFVFGDKS